MRTLLSIEWLKIRRYPTFWVLVALFAVMLPIWNYGIANGAMQFSGNGKDGVNFLSTAYSFPGVWGNLGFWGSIFISFIAILVIILSTNEFSYRTNRQNIIDGWSRLEFYHAKVLLVVILSLFATLYVFFDGLFLGWSNSGSFTNVFSEFYKLFYFFLLSVNYLGFGLLIAVCVKKSGLAIGLFLFYAAIGENILKSLINFRMDAPYGNFLPLQCSDELLPFQLMQMMKVMLPVSSIATNTYAVVTIAWCLIYYFVGRAILLRRDW